MPVPKRAAKQQESTPAAAYAMRDDTQAVSDAPVPLVERARPPFILCYNPLGWAPADVDGTVVWLPEVMEIPVIPGTNGAFVTLKGQDPSDSIRSMRAYLRDERGLVPLDRALQVPPGVLPAGVPGGSWSRSLEVRVRGIQGQVVSYLTPWHLAAPTMPGAPIKFKLHRASWDRFRAWLVSEGHIVADATLAAVQAEHVRRAAARLDRAETTAYPNEAIATKRIAARRAVLESAQGAQLPEVA